jgi:hypothetical protein
MATLSPFAQARRKSEYFLKALEIRDSQNPPPAIKGHFVTTDESANPLGVNPYSTLKRARKPVDAKSPEQILTPSRKLSTLLVVVTHWVNSYIRLRTCG